MKKRVEDSIVNIEKEGRDVPGADAHGEEKRKRAEEGVPRPGKAQGEALAFQASWGRGRCASAGGEDR